MTPTLETYTVYNAWFMFKTKMELKRFWNFRHYRLWTIFGGQSERLLVYQWALNILTVVPFFFKIGFIPLLTCSLPGLRFRWDFSIPNPEGFSSLIKGIYVTGRRLQFSAVLSVLRIFRLLWKNPRPPGNRSLTSSGSQPRRCAEPLPLPFYFASACGIIKLTCCTWLNVVLIFDFHR